MDDAPYTVRTVRVEPDRIVLALSDGTEEAWDPETSRVGPDGALYAQVKVKAGARGADARGGPFEAKFSPFAQASLGPVLVATEARERGELGELGELEAAAAIPAVRVGGRAVAIGAAKTRLG